MDTGERERETETGNTWKYFYFLKVYMPFNYPLLNWSGMRWSCGRGQNFISEEAVTSSSSQLMDI